MGRALVYIVPIALLIYALIDFSRSLPDERADIPSPAWVLIILVPVVGPLTWILVSRSRRTGEQVTPGGGRPGPGHGPAPRSTSRPPVPPRRSGTPAPDDDPDFLWRLEQQRRRDARRDRRRTDPPGNGHSDTGRPGPEEPGPGEPTG